MCRYRLVPACGWLSISHLRRRQEVDVNPRYPAGQTGAVGSAADLVGLHFDQSAKLPP